MILKPQEKNTEIEECLLAKLKKWLWKIWQFGSGSCSSGTLYNCPTEGRAIESCSGVGLRFTSSTTWKQLRLSSP